MIGSKAMSGRVINDPACYLRPDGMNIQACLERVEETGMTLSELSAVLKT
jgi:N-carbamoyl-L-amino-acid hydrolase